MDTMNEIPMEETHSPQAADAASAHEPSTSASRKTASSGSASPWSALWSVVMSLEKSVPVSWSWLSWTGSDCVVFS